VASTKTTCCIVGGGPAGMMFAFLLARAGIPVVVMEKHADFLRDFRGDTVHPSTLEMMHELGLLEEFLRLPHSVVRQISLQIGEDRLVIGHFDHLPVHCKFIALAAMGFPQFPCRSRQTLSDLRPAHADGSSRFDRGKRARCRHPRKDDRGCGRNSCRPGGGLRRPSLHDAREGGPRER
jgi:hypothetical protein